MLGTGDTIGPYTLVRLLGQGGYGNVWLAERSTSIFTLKVALKLPRIDTANMDAVLREALSWLQASGHPNVVPVLDADEYDGLFVIASEYVAGGTLDDWLRANHGPAPDIDFVVRLADGILCGLNYLHSSGLVHRDLKPGNVLLQGGIPRLTDFGLSRALDSRNFTEHLSGSPSYMAPEAFSGAYSYASDLWSLGVVLYEALSGGLPFYNPDVLQLMCAIRDDTPVDLSESVPGWLRGFVTRLLARAPGDRFSSAQDALVALRLHTAAVPGHAGGSGTAAASNQSGQQGACAPLSWTVQLMGEVRLRRTDGTIVELPTRRSAALLARLALAPGSAHRREDLMEALWPGATLDQQRNTMSVELNRLRRCLDLPGIPGKRILTGVASLRLEPEYAGSDTGRIHELIGRAKACPRSADRIPLLQEAVELYRPELFPDLDYDWIADARSTLDRTYVEAVEKLITDLASAGHHDRAVEIGRDLVDRDRFSEERHALFMFALIQAGRPCDALQQYNEMVELFRREHNGAPGPRTRKFGEEAKRRCEAQPVAVAGGPCHNGPKVPQTFTPILGRNEDLERLTRLVLDPGVFLLTLTGTGGGGKTRLAVEVARHVSADFDGAVWFVSLADMNDRAAVIGGLCATLEIGSDPGSEPIEKICRTLSAQPSLLVLDNFEHLTDCEAALVDELLSRVPHLTCLVTSRRSLQSAHETVYELPPLPIPPALGRKHGNQAPNLEDNPSIQLFLQRARRAKPEFVLTPENTPSIIELARRLDGIPLAIELAAAWARTLTPADMLLQIKDILVSRDRSASIQHRSLDAVIGGSFARLPEEGRELMLRLAVFRGGWTVDAAKSVCDEPRALALLGELHDASMILSRESGGSMRFRMLEPIHEYAHDRLLESGRMVRFVRRHRQYFLSLATEAAAGLSGPDYGQWLHRLDDELANLVSALMDAETHERLAGAAAVYKYWIGRGRIAQGREWLEGAIGGLDALPRSAHGEVLLAAGILAWLAGDAESARARLHASLAVCQERGDERGSLKALANLANIEFQQGEVEAARRDHKASVAVARRLDDRRLLASILGNYGTFCEQTGDSASAQQHLEEALALHVRLNNRSGKADVLHNLADIAEGQKRYDDALELLAECLEISDELGDYGRVPQALMLLAILALDKKEIGAAVRVFASAERAFEILGIAPQPSEFESCRSEVERAGQNLFERERQELRREGLEMQVPEAIRSAIADARRWCNRETHAI